MKKLFKILGIIVLLTAAGIGIYLFNIYTDVRDTMEDIFVPIVTEDVREEELDLSSGEPFSVLLLGIDSDGPNDPGRSDSMMVVTVNPALGSTYILSIQRDTRVDIPGRGWDKINHAYAFGGAELSINTVQDFLNIPIDYFVGIDMDGFEVLIDTVGGVTVDNTTLSFYQSGYYFPLGEQHLSGSQALQFTRMRLYDPRGDFGRMERQRLVLEALARRLATFALTRHQAILDTISSYIATNITIGDIMTLSTHHLGALGEIHLEDLGGTGQIINGIWYLNVSEEARLAAQNRLREHLELD